MGDLVSNLISGYVVWVSDFGGRLSGHLNVTGRLYGRLYESGRLLYGSLMGAWVGELSNGCSGEMIGSMLIYVCGSHGISTPWPIQN